MSKHPVKVEKRALRRVGDNSIATIEAVAPHNPFLSFRYSYTEMSAAGSRARVKSRSARYEDGKLTTEEFDGELDRGAYERMVSEAQRHLRGRAGLFARLFLPFLSSPGKSFDHD
jgi:hypothetical protein